MPAGRCHRDSGWQRGPVQAMSSRRLPGPRRPRPGRHGARTVTVYRQQLTPSRPSLKSDGGTLAGGHHAAVIPWAPAALPAPNLARPAGLWPWDGQWPRVSEHAAGGLGLLVSETAEFALLVRQLESAHARRR
jgi:hypothetical protein